MDLEVRWSPEATEDLEAIAEFIAGDSEFYARAVIHSMSRCGAAGLRRYSVESGSILVPVYLSKYFRFPDCPL